MKKIAVIPARFAATRFPGKLMEKIGDKTIIRMVYENAISTKLFDEVLVVTDSEVIFNEIKANGGNVVMSKGEHQSGSDRIAEAIEELDVDVVINIQGDEPFIKKEPLQDLLNSFSDPNVQVASLMKKFDPKEEIGNPNWVKVVFNLKKDALYFSRSIIPFKRNLSSLKSIYKHIGVYGFRKNTLLSFTRWPMGELEQTEMLEQLRYLENGVNIRMVETTEISLGIDTPEDLESAKRFFQSTRFNSN